jgi:DNA repair and recombination RAD54-like protein
MNRHQPRPSTSVEGKENIAPTSKASRLYGGSQKSTERLARPFKCPGSSTPIRISEKPARKRRKVDYGGADGDADEEGGDKPWTNNDRLALANRDANKFPVFKVKDKDAIFRARFNVPLINKAVGDYKAPKNIPALGMRKGVIFVPKALHDPSGEFAIVLYDPTIDDKPNIKEVLEDGENEKPVEMPKLDVPLMHKSLADILGLKKEVVDENPKIPVVIDPRLAKVLRPHQVEGVKVGWSPTCGDVADQPSSCIDVQLA